MRALIAHNHYGDRATGGEETVFNNETNLLRDKGIEVETFERSNIELANFPLRKKISAACSFRFQDVREDATRIIRRFRPDILHVHNYKFVFSTAVFEAARDLGVGIVLSIHNYRLLCPGGQLRRGAVPCEECLHRNPVRSLWRKGCASSFFFRALQYSFYRNTRDFVKECVDAFVLPTRFAKEKFLTAGFPEEKLFVKPYFLFDPKTELQSVESFRFFPRQAVFVGRLSEEKGIRLLIDAWRDIDYPLVVVGDGPDRERVSAFASSNVRFLGNRPSKETLQIIGASDFLVFPSVCYEGLGMTLLEAFAMGVPVVASNLGSRREIVGDGETKAGLLFESGDRDSLKQAVLELTTRLEQRRKYGEAARKRYELFYSPERNYQQLIQIYQSIIDRKKCSRL